VEYNDVVAFELECIACVAFAASLFAFVRRSVTAFHVLDENMRQCIGNEISS
jgi:hypothetical protein